VEAQRFRKSFLKEKNIYRTRREEKQESRARKGNAGNKLVHTGVRRKGKTGRENRDLK